jgi:hypothetical protein
MEPRTRLHCRPASGFCPVAAWGGALGRVNEPRLFHRVGRVARWSIKQVGNVLSRAVRSSRPRVFTTSCCQPRLPPVGSGFTGSGGGAGLFLSPRQPSSLGCTPLRRRVPQQTGSRADPGPPPDRTTFEISCRDLGYIPWGQSPGLDITQFSAQLLADVLSSTRTRTDLFRPNE